MQRRKEGFSPPDCPPRHASLARSVCGSDGPLRRFRPTR